MGAKRLSMRQLREILRFKYEQELSHRAIAEPAERQRRGWNGRFQRIWTMQPWKRGCFPTRDQARGNECLRIWNGSTRS